MAKKKKGLDFLKLLTQDQLLQFTGESIATVGWEVEPFTHMPLERWVQRNIWFTAMTMNTQPAPWKSIRFSVYNTDRYYYSKSLSGYVIAASLESGPHRFPLGISKVWRRAATVLGCSAACGGNVHNKPKIIALAGIDPNVWLPRAAAALAVMSFIHCMNYEPLKGVAPAKLMNVAINHN